MREHEEGAGGHEYRIWTLLMLELRFRTYIDRAAVDMPVALSAA